MIDSTCCKAHQASAGARKTAGPQAIGITRGGLNTKIHAVCDALGNLLRFVLTPGQQHDSRPAQGLLENLPAKALLADKAYDSDKIVQCARGQGMQVVIPCKVNRKQQRAWDKQRYKARHLIEPKSGSYKLAEGRGSGLVLTHSLVPPSIPGCPVRFESRLQAHCTM